MFALLKQELRLFAREGASLLLSLMFFLCLILLLPFGLGADGALLAKIAPAMLWIGLLLATLLGVESLFKQDKEDGTLEGLVLGETPLALLALTKAFAHWLTHGLPLVLLTPLLGVMLNFPLEQSFTLIFSLFFGSIALTLIGVFHAALAVSLKKGGMLMAVLGLPFTFPVLIFGVSAHENASAMYLLSGFTLLLLVLIPLLCALALKSALE